MKILIIRFSSIGDVILCSSIIRAVKHQLGAEVHLLTKSFNERWLYHNQNIDRIIGFDSFDSDIIDDLRSENYDLVIDLHKNLRSKRIIRSLNVLSLDFDKVNIQKWVLVNFKVNRLPDKHIVDRYFEAVSSLGITNDGEGLDFFIDPKITSPKYLPNKYIVISLGASFGTKRIPISLIEEIIQGVDVPVVLIGGQDVLEIGQSITSKCINKVGVLSIQESAKVISGSELLITSDSAMLHIASALKKEQIVLWGNTVPAFGMGPYYGKHKISFKSFEVDGLKCRPCSKLGYNSCPKGHFRCMMLQDSKSIIDAIAGMIQA